MNRKLVILIVSVVSLTLIAFLIINREKFRNIDIEYSYPPKEQTEETNIPGGKTKPIEIPTLTTEHAIAEEFSKKYSRPISDIELIVTEDTGEFAYGTVGFKDEFGGGMWFGAFTKNGWELAFDGNGIMSCSIADKYNFPSEIVSGCVGGDNNDEFVER